MLSALRQQVLDANLELIRRGLVIEAFGNVSGIDRESGIVVIKPSGVPYDRLAPEGLVAVDLDGRTVEGELRPSSDLPTHLALYRAFPSVGGVAHTHSRHATSWAQAGREIPCLGTTHADYFRGSIPVTEPMTSAEIRAAYEWNTGQVIVRRFTSLDPVEFPAVLVNGHGPFCWGPSAAAAASMAGLVEEVAAMALQTLVLNPSAAPISPVLRDKHFLRKHGPDAYYGQK
ncbi:MAG: L-ribulose-5-phosphate 4-epimerase AraD [Acidobacteria bacterium]|nr:MAG: L-ribulose-5-phosphate 4-epimerase AraD [Acidobacteriota bacterium]